MNLNINDHAQLTILNILSAESQLELKGASFDCISSVQFLPTNSNNLLVLSWDLVCSLFLIHLFSRVQSSLSISTVVIQTVRLYDIKANEENTKFDHHAAFQTRRTHTVEDLIPGQERVCVIIVAIFYHSDHKQTRTRI